MKKIHHSVKHFIFSFIDLFYGPFKKLMPLQTFRYLACGGGNTLFDILLFKLFYEFVFHKQNFYTPFYTFSPHIAALFLAFSISFSTGFYLNRFITFKESGLRKRTQLSRFILLNAICIGLNFVLMKLFVDGLHFFATPSKIMATIIIAFLSYMMQTYIFFKPKESLTLSR